MNKHKGEIPLKVGNKEYSLKFTTNSLCELEEVLGMTTLDMIDSLKSSMGLKQLRCLVWAATLDNHKGLSMNEVGEIIDAVGFNNCLKACGEALNAGFPTGKNSKEK